MIGFAVVADDLTGALVSATRLRQRGLNVEIVWTPSQLSRDGSIDAVVVDMRTRDMKRGHYARSFSWGKLLVEAGYTRLECRMDSTLRGHTHEEVTGLADAIGHGSLVLLAVPAIPIAGRVTKGGIQQVYNESSGIRFSIDVAPAVFGRAPDLLVDSGMIASGGRQIANLILQACAPSGPTCVIADGETGRDLAVTAHAANLLAAHGQPLLTVSPGEWLAHYPRLDEGEFTLVLVSSPTQENVAQQSQFEGLPDACLLGPTEVLADPSGSWVSMLRSGMTIVISTITGGPSIIRQSALAGQAAQAAVAVLHAADRRGLRCSRVVVSGGQTAQLLVDALGIPGLWPLDQVGPMCSRARINGGRWDGLIIVTKGGQMGSPGTLVALAEGANSSPDKSSITPFVADAAIDV
jgi:uncharacterized protein YgbK (DUF1537 family)